MLISNCSYYSYKGSLPVGISSISVSSVENNTSEFSFSNLINNKITNLIIKDNIIDIVDINDADSRLNIRLINMKDSPEVYSLNEEIFGNVEQWKMEILYDILWLDLKTGNTILSKQNKKWAMYNTSDLDMNNDNIDNDLDGFIDSEDSDEYGAPREGAIRIISEKISQQIVTELISTW